MLAFLIGLLLGLMFGWNSAHHTIANECKKLGGFFIGREIFKCIKVEEQPISAEHQASPDQ